MSPAATNIYVGYINDTTGEPAMPNAKQKLAHETICDELCYGGAAGGGKALSIDELLPTPTGWVRNGDVQAGDVLFDDHGQPMCVVQAHPVQMPECFRVTFDDGATIVASADHRWLTYTAAELSALSRRRDDYRARRRYRRPSRALWKRPDVAMRNRIYTPPTRPAPAGQIRTTKQIAATVRLKSGRANHAMPVAMALDLPDAVLPIEPYLFGLWLGDGTTRGGSITTADVCHVRQAVTAAGFEIGAIQEKPGTSAVLIGVNGLLTKLRACGVFGHKHIPWVYHRASQAQRLALLQGLMDSDGTVDKESGCVEFNTTNIVLVRGVYELIVSLGWKAHIREERAMLNGRDCGPAFGIKWTPNSHVFRLPRKRDWQLLATRRTTRFRYVVSCEPCESEPMRCLTVENPRGLFLAGPHMLVTHNSEWLLMEAASTCLEHPGVEVALFRRTFEELEASLILRSQALFHNLVEHKIARYEAGRKRWVFKHPKGASYLWFRYCAREADVYRYQSAQWVMLGMDEATHFTEFQYQYLTSRVRSRQRGVGVKIRLATNPGNVGHAWVKRRFIKPESVETGGRIIEPGQVWKPLAPPDRPTLKTMTRCFIPARLHDNTALMEADPEYFNRLQQLPEDERRMLSEGDWDVWKGQMFSEFVEFHRVTDADFELQAAGVKVGQVIPWHKIPDASWEPPPGASVQMSVDYGYAAPWAAYFHAVLPGGRVITFKEFYLTRKRDFQQARILCEYVKGIWARQRANGQAPWDIQWGVMDRSMWGSRMEQGLGKSIAEVYEDELGIKTSILLKPGSTDRHARVQRVKHALSTAPDGFPWWQITAACPNLLRTLPELPHDPEDPEDVDCWVAGTMVETPTGPRAIETIAPGDLVTTPIGARPVLRAYCSGTSATSVVHLADGCVLRGTPHHPVFVRGKGLVPLEALVIGDCLLENSRWLRWLSIVGWCIAGIRDACTTRPVQQPFIAAQPAYIDRSGSIAARRFRQGAISTMWTAITTTIRSRIWPAFEDETISRPMSEAVWPVTLDNGSRDGVSRRLVAQPFETTPGKCASVPSDTNRRAAIVTALSWPFRIKSIVQDRANRLGITRWISAAQSVGRRFGRSAITFDRWSPVRIVAVGRSDANEPVYNLTVADAHLFYANGVLSSNTDAEDHAYDSVGLYWQARPELPKPEPIYHTYANLDQLSRDHALVMQKRYDQKRKPGVLNVKGFILG